MNQDTQAVGLLFLLVLATSLPFVTRAYFVDDYYHVTMAKGLLAHPARPYDFVADDAGPNQLGWEKGKPPRMVNPPVFHYFLAGVMALWGDAPWKLRSASLIFPLISVFCAYFLGKRFCSSPLAAAALMALTPAFWLTSYSLLVDGALVAFFLAALLVFLIAQERRSVAWALISGLLMGLTVLTKYTGALIVPVALCWQWLEQDRASWRGGYAAYLSAAVVIGLWGLWTASIYGRMHIVAAISQGVHPTSFLGSAFACLLVLGFILKLVPKRREVLSRGAYAMWGLCVILALAGLYRGASLNSWIQNFYVDKFLVLGSFLGGGTIFLLFSLFLAGRQSPWAAMAVIGGVTVFFLIFASHWGGFNLVQSGELSFFIGSALAFLVMIFRGVAGTEEPHDRFLVLWIFVGLLELVGAMQWTAGRYLLLILPPLTWLFFSAVEELGSRRISQWACVVTGVTGLLLAYADFAQSRAITRFAPILREEAPRLEALSPRPPHHWYFLGDTFTGYTPYLSPLGWQSAFPNQTFEPGDLLVRSRYRMSSWWTIPGQERFEHLASYPFPSKIPLRVMDVPAAAGFYASCWGALPFTITRDPLEQFDLYYVR
jgi:4-amino-4-deoxy-L-arabinose transferase-like glycosyltransferase